MDEKLVQPNIPYVEGNNDELCSKIQYNFEFTKLFK